jgi:hypothetical protein
MLTKFRLRKQGFDMTAYGLPAGITPEMLQMLKNMIQSQQMAVAAGPGRQSSFDSGNQIKNRGIAARPSDVIALDDAEFGNF